MEQSTIMMVMQTCQAYAEALKIRTLTEYEALMYEQCCNLVASFCKQHDTIHKAQQLGLERAAYEAEQEHQKWERIRDAAEQNHPDRKPFQRDEDTDADGGGAGVPVE